MGLNVVAEVQRLNHYMVFRLKIMLVTVSLSVILRFQKTTCFDSLGSSGQRDYNSAEGPGVVYC